MMLERFLGTVLLSVALTAGCESRGATTGAATAQTQESAPVVTAKPVPQCPAGMQLVSGGEFRSGSPEGKGPDDEHPRFRTKMHSFCMDRTEVTVAAYSQCEETGKCESAARKVKTCNGGRESRQNHPINCVTSTQAATFCSSLGKRLPSEVEWEFAARGGAELRKFSWGSESPDGRTCWKRGGTCEVGQYAEGAFELHDMIGNVWEWTDSYYGHYPWPERNAWAMVYRGGSWSRRFEKWMSPTLRNRYGPDKWGSHLGFRCAQLLETPDCPYGIGEGGHCLQGVEDAECPEDKQWNGVRCTSAGETSTKDGCTSGSHNEPGFGCVLDDSSATGAIAKGKAPKATVRRRRTAGFDADCRTHEPTRPRAYRLVGGTHEARNIVVRRRGCKNRDVGVGWNSACCP